VIDSFEPRGRQLSLAPSLSRKLEPQFWKKPMLRSLRAAALFVSAFAFAAAPASANDFRHHHEQHRHSHHHPHQTHHRW